MNKMMRFSFILLLTLLYPTTPSFAASEKQKLQQIDRQIEQLSQKQLQSELKRKKLTNALKFTDITISQLNVSLDKLSKSMSKTDKAIATINEEKAPLEAQLQSQQKLLANQLRVSYNLGKYQYLKLLLNQHDPAITSRLLSYIGYINNARAQTLKKIFNLKSILEDKEQQYRAHLNELAALKNKQAEKEKALVNQKNTQQTLIKDIQEQILTRQDKINDYKRTRKKLANIIKRINLKRALENLSFAKMRHRLPWPVEGMAINQFGDNKDNNEINYNGVVFKAPEGRKIIAVHDGRVAFADWLKGFGLLLIINHGKGYMTLYANNQALYHELGDRVKTGDVIASVGHSGGQLEDGLYFEIRHNGKPINPKFWLKNQYLIR